MSLAVVFGSALAALSYGQGAIKTITAGPGLAGGGSTQTVTIYIPTGAISVSMLSPGAQVQLTGPQGPSGATGSQGPQGSQGVAGATGATGAAGGQGLVGPVGPIGAVGPEGPVGPQGPAGATGATGATGAQGPQGVVGPVGPIGAMGPQGPKGDTGATGATGAQGAQGVKGDTGSTGATGAAGPKGDTGATGAQGLQGVKGDSGSAGTSGAQGVKGDTGATGPQGVQGPKGDKGDTGSTGATGAQGPAGTSLYEHFANKNDLLGVEGGPWNLPDQTFAPNVPTVLRFEFSGYFDHFTTASAFFQVNLYVHANGTDTLVDSGKGNEFPGNTDAAQGIFLTKMPAIQDVNNGDANAYYILRVSNFDEFDDLRTETSVSAATP